MTVLKAIERERVTVEDCSFQGTFGDSSEIVSVVRKDMTCGGVN